MMRSELAHVYRDLSVATGQGVQTRRAKDTQPTYEQEVAESDARLEEAYKIAPEQRAINDQIIEIASDGPKYWFRRSGNIWHVHFEDEDGHFRNYKGFDVIAALLATPNPTEPVSAILLMGRVSSEVHITHTAQPAMDKTALADYNAQLGELDREIEKAKEGHDEQKEESLQRQKIEILTLVGKATGIHGRARNIGPKSPAESARTSCRAAIDRAIEAMGKATKPLPKLADYLTRHIKTEGSAYAYRTDDPPPWDL
jgi:hypothetical protein